MSYQNEAIDKEYIFDLSDFGNQQLFGQNPENCSFCLLRLFEWMGAVVSAFGGVFVRGFLVQTYSLTSWRAHVKFPENSHSDSPDPSGPGYKGYPLWRRGKNG